MATLDILYEGYVQESEDGELVRNTVCLVSDGDVRMIVDPGLVYPPGILTDALAVHGLQPEDITHVYITHYHLDHVRYVGMFTRAVVIDHMYVYERETWSDHSGDGYEITSDIRIMHTPGHSLDDSTLLVHTNLGVMAISHVWWFPDRSPIEDPMAYDQHMLNDSRKRVEAVADWIVTPHGGLLKVKD